MRISRSLLDRIFGHAAQCHPREACGLLLGQNGEIVAVAPTDNVAADPERRFEIDPAALIAAHRSARAGGAAILGHYHSHPSGKAAPSACDADMAHADGAYWLIVSGDDVGLWRAGAEGLHGRFATVDMAVVGD